MIARYLVRDMSVCGYGEEYASTLRIACRIADIDILRARIVNEPIYVDILEYDALAHDYIPAIRMLDDYSMEALS